MIPTGDTAAPVEVLINEVLADPHDAAGDAGCDGVVGPGDAFVEIVNIGAGTVDLAGWSLGDSTNLRHTFPAPTVLDPGGAVVVFGGGAPALDGLPWGWCGPLGSDVVVQVASSGTLALDSTGDDVRLVDAAAALVDSVTFGPEAGNDRSLVRSPELTVAAPLALHDCAVQAVGPWSPGTRADGAPLSFGPGAPPDTGCVPALDGDGDGMDDDLEVLIPTDPTTADTDGDGLDDPDELRAGVDPLDADSDDDGVADGVDAAPLQVDGDADGLADGVEVGATAPVPGGTSPGGLAFAGTDGPFDADADPVTTTDPTLPDTDGDGLLDGEEDLNHDGAFAGDQAGLLDDETDPDDDDSDGDGASDGAEGGPGPYDADSDGTLDALDPDTVPVDTDGDGLYDPEEIALGTDPTVPDTDGDGLFDGEEVWVWGTNPLLLDTDGGGAGDGAEAGAGFDPLDPTDDGLFLDPDMDGLQTSVELTLGTDPTNPDTDGDGLRDGVEVNVYGTDPLNPDSDGDGAGDGGEVSVGTNPLDPDTDHDGLGDREEGNAGTSPLNPDTDGDGLSDGDEVLVWQTDPRVPDTDGDQLSDGEEVDLGTSPTRADTDGDLLDDGAEVGFGTDPTRSDTDGGGVDDGTEVARGSDPLDPSDDLGGVGSTGDTGADALEGLKARGSCGCATGPGTGLPGLAWVFSGWIVLRRCGRKTATRG